MKSELKITSAALRAGDDEHVRSPRYFRKKVLTPLVCSVLASVGIFGGISSLFAGLICVVIHSIISGDTIFDRAGTVLLMVAIPMILAGTLFIDEINQRGRSQ